MNSVCLQGNVTRDPVVTLLPTGTKKANFSIAVNEKPYTNKNGEEIRPVHYFDVESFGSGADAVADKIKKGTSVTVQGMLRQDRWEKDGEKRQKVYVRCTEFKVNERRSNNEEQPSPQPTHDEVPAVAVGGNDIPF